MKHHLKHMLIAGGIVLAILLLLRVDLRTALPYAVLLACPLGMVAMMVMMGRSAGHDHRDAGHDGAAGGHDGSAPESSAGEEPERQAVRPPV